MKQIPQAARQILMELENGIGRFSYVIVSDSVRRSATKILDGTADVLGLWRQYATYEEQGLVQGGPVRPKTAQADKRFLSRALRLIVAHGQIL